MIVPTFSFTKAKKSMPTNIPAPETNSGMSALPAFLFTTDAFGCQFLMFSEASV